RRLDGVTQSAMFLDTDPEVAVGKACGDSLHIGAFGQFDLTLEGSGSNLHSEDAAVARGLRRIRRRSITPDDPFITQDINVNLVFLEACQLSTDIEMPLALVDVYRGLP